MARGEASGASNWLLYCSINIPHPAFQTNATWLNYVNHDKVSVPIVLERKEMVCKRFLRKKEKARGTEECCSSFKHTANSKSTKQNEKSIPPTHTCPFPSPFGATSHQMRSSRCEKPTWPCVQRQTTCWGLSFPRECWSDVSSSFSGTIQFERKYLTRDVPILFLDYIIYFATSALMFTTHAQT